MGVPEREGEIVYLNMRSAVIGSNNLTSKVDPTTGEVTELVIVPETPLSAIANATGGFLPTALAFIAGKGVD